MECEVSHLINSRKIREREREINPQCSLAHSFSLLVFSVNQNQRTEDHREVGRLNQQWKASVQTWSVKCSSSRLLVFILYFILSSLTRHFLQTAKRFKLFPEREKKSCSCRILSLFTLIRCVNNKTSKSSPIKGTTNMLLTHTDHVIIRTERNKIRTFSHFKHKSDWQWKNHQKLIPAENKQADFSLVLINYTLSNQHREKKSFRQILVKQLWFLRGQRIQTTKANN